MLKRLIESHLEHPNYQHEVVSLTGIGQVGPRLRAMGLKVHALNMRSPFAIPSAVWHLVRRIKALRPDIIQTWMYHADLLGGLAARLAGNRNVIWGIHSTDVQACGSRSTTIVMHLCAWLSRWIPHTIVCVAEAARRSHVGAGYDASRMSVVYGGFNLAALTATSAQRDALRSKCGFSAAHLVIGTVGRFNQAKDYETFVRAAGLLARQHTQIRFLMIGKELNAGNSELLAWIAKTGLEDRFVLLGERVDVPVCMATMDIFCLSSRTEAFPAVVGEAMAMGLPCVVTDVGDTAMLLGGAGKVVPKENPVALAAGLRELLALSECDRQELGRQAKARIGDEFTVQRAREGFEKIYQRVTAHGRN